MIVFMFGCATTSNLTEVQKPDVIVSRAKDLDKPHIIPENMIPENWEQVAVEPFPQFGFADMYFANKELDADIPYIVLRTVPQYQMIIGYAYMFEGAIYIFQASKSGEGYEPAKNLATIDVEFWQDKFKEHFFNRGNLALI